MRKQGKARLSSSFLFTIQLINQPISYTQRVARALGIALGIPLPSPLLGTKTGWALLVRACTGYELLAPLMRSLRASMRLLTVALA